MEENKTMSIEQMVEVLNNQLQMFQSQMQVKNEEILRMMDDRTDLAIKIKVTEDSIKHLINPLPNILTSSANKPQFSREWTREYMKHRKKWSYPPVQTREIVDRFYKNEPEEEKSKAIKILSVVFNNLIKSGEVSVERKKGIKGSFYLWNGDI